MELFGGIRLRRRDSVIESFRWDRTASVLACLAVRMPRSRHVPELNRRHGSPLADEDFLQVGRDGVLDDASPEAARLLCPVYTAFFRRRLGIQTHIAADD